MTQQELLLTEFLKETLKDKKKPYESAVATDWNGDYEGVMVISYQQDGFSLEVETLMPYYINFLESKLLGE